MVRLDDHADNVLVHLYRTCPRTVDDLPYTPDFARLHSEFKHRSGLTLSEHDVWLELCYLRKRGRLPRKRR